MDFTALVTAVDFASALTAMASVAAAGFGIRVAMKGIQYVKSALSRA